MSEKKCIHYSYEGSVPSKECDDNVCNTDCPNYKREHICLGPEDELDSDGNFKGRKPNAVVVDDAVDLELSKAIVGHPCKSVLEEALERLREEKNKAFNNWLATSLEAGTHEDAPRDLLFRIGFYAGYDVGCIPIGPVDEGKPPYSGFIPPDGYKGVPNKRTQDKLKVIAEDKEPITPKGYGELKVGMEGKLNGVPVVVRKITKKDIIMRPLNRSIRDKHGMMVSFEEGKANV